MITLLSKLLKYENSTEKRGAYGSLCAWVGIILNVLLFAFKFFAGLISGAMSITVDAFNNLSDAGASFISLISFKVSDKQSDAEHPFGHGRIEYVTSLVIAIIIIVMGIELVRTSIEKIVTPQEIEISILVIVILIVSIITKLYIVFYNTRIGNSISSLPMKATAKDSLCDAIITFIILTSLLLTRFIDMNIDGYLGVVVSLFVLYSGYSVAKETMSYLIGRVPDAELVKKIYDIVESYEFVNGMHDLIVHDYGPDRRMISLHVEMPVSLDILEMHNIVESIERELVWKLNCKSVIHIDPFVIDDVYTLKLKNKVVNALRKVDIKIEVHDFRIVEREKYTKVLFDVYIPQEISCSENEIRKIVRRVMGQEERKCFAIVRVEKLYVQKWIWRI